ncbi:MAG: sulfur carrier protein ThiS [Succinivibrionaceae bacterium]|nr:sulfur carrier protein ThiS [Succinivibrionaceae bacterium]
MMIDFNGKKIETSAATLMELLVEQGILQKGAYPYGIAVGINDAVVPKAQYETCQLTENDRVEVFKMVAGGCCGR